MNDNSVIDKHTTRRKSRDWSCLWKCERKIKWWQIKIRRHLSIILLIIICVEEQGEIIDRIVLNGSEIKIKMEIGIEEINLNWNES